MHRRRRWDTAPGPDAARLRPPPPVYRDLRSRGVVVKTGFKYGTHFRAYEGDPEKIHARYLVHSLPADYRGGWPEVSRAVRLAHGVKKHLVLASCGESIAYVHLERVRP